MKNKLLSALIILSVVKGFSQTELTAFPTYSKEYAEAKAKLVVKQRQKDDKYEGPKVITEKGAEHLTPGSFDLSKPSGGGNRSPINGHSNRMPLANPCECLQTLDATYSVVPFSGYTAPDYRNDDGSTNAIALPFTYCLYGANYTSVYINNNGNISFGAAYFTYNPVAFPSAAYTMVAPFWADVETYNTTSGLVYYKITPTALIVQWDHVGYYSNHVDKLNTFQVIITNGADPILPAGDNTGFCYGNMEWTTGDASLGSGGFGTTYPAIVGANDGGGVNYYQIGEFGMAGGAYTGSYAIDGVSWLNNQSLYANSCSNTNIPPIPSIANCDTVKVCGLNDTVLFPVNFLSPEPGQITTISYNLFGIPGFSCISNTPGNTATAVFQFIGSALNYGINNITITGTDNGVPVGISAVNLTIQVDTTGASLLNPVISGPTHFCVGDSAHLNVTPTTYDAYLWSTGSTTDSTWANHTGVYTVTAWLNGCQKTVPYSVQATPLPTPVITGNSVTACGTGTTTLSSDSLIYSSYLWSNAASTSSITVGAGNYTLTVTDANGCTFATAPFNVTSAPPPTILAHDDTLFCNGGVANLWVDFTGPTIPLNCMLSTTGGCGGSAATATMGTGVASNSDFSYPAPFGNFYTSTVQQYLYTAAELNAIGVTGGKIDQLDYNVTFINTASGAISTYHEFTIKMGCTNLTGFNNFGTTGTAPAFVPGMMTVYPAATYNVITGWNTFPFTTAFEWDGISNVIVEVCSSEGPPFPNWTYNCQSTQTATANVSSQWFLSDTYDQCGGAAATIGFGNSGFLHPDMQLHWCSLVHNPSDYSYQWTAFPGPGGIANDTMQVTTASPTVATTIYQVSVVSINGGCAALDSVTVNTVNLNTMHITPAGPYCLASPIDTLQVSVPIGTGVYSGTGITDTNLGIFDPAVAGLGNHVIHYTVTSSFCGSADTSITILVASQLDPTITYVGRVCNTWNAFNLTAASPGGHWTGRGVVDSLAGTFNPGLPAALGNDTITYTIYVPCFSRDTAVITVEQQLYANIDSVPPICIDAAPITFNSIGAGGTWSGVGITNPATGTFSPAVAGAGPHVITHYYNQLCGDTATTTIIVVPLPVISVTADDTDGCAPHMVHFTSTNDQPGGTCFWNLGDGHNSTNCNPSEMYTSFNGGIPYTVTFIYTNSIGCVSSITKTDWIHVYSQPVAIFTANPQPTDITSPEIHFTDHSTGVINNWTWSFGTGAGSTLQNPSYTYADTGHYQVMLVVINNNGCVDTTIGMIVIDPILTCYIPSAFTPTGNGVNDEFRIYGTDILKDGFELDIFDRWGERIFVSNDMNKGWNGAKNNSGNIVELGVYIYKVHLKDWRGLDHDYVGHVTLIK